MDEYQGQHDKEVNEGTMMLRASPLHPETAGCSLPGPAGLQLCAG